MPFTICPFRRFPVPCAVKYRSGQLSGGILCLIFLLPLCSWAGVETLTAVCNEPKGRVIGIEGPIGGNKPVDEPEGMPGAQITLIWEIMKDEAQVVTQGDGGGSPLYERVIRVYSSDEMHTFLVTHRFEVWVYSIFPKSSRLLMTQHTNGFSLDRGGAIAKSMEARCEMSVK
jgi:hypothetical protein